MARKVDKRGQSPAAPKGAAGAKDLDVLQPDCTLTIGGRVVVVREYRFFEGFRLQAEAKPFFDALYELFAHSGGPPIFDDVAELLAEHEEATLRMVQQASGCDPEWIRTLDDADGTALMATWWLANAGFFIRRLMRRAAQAHQAAQRSAGPGSSTDSLPADTSGAPTTSPP